MGAEVVPAGPVLRVVLVAGEGRCGSAQPGERLLLGKSLCLLSEVGMFQQAQGGQGSVPVWGPRAPGSTGFPVRIMGVGWTQVRGRQGYISEDPAPSRVSCICCSESLWLGPGLVPAPRSRPTPRRSHLSLCVLWLAQQLPCVPLLSPVLAGELGGHSHLSTGGGGCLVSGLGSVGADPLALWPPFGLTHAIGCEWAHKGWRHVKAGLPEATAGPPSLICAVTT